jgi:trimeric autotransporter adhesin
MPGSVAIRFLSWFVLLAPVSLIAQSYQGGIRGTVTDVSGASISGANVSLTDEATKLVRNAVTTGSGEYVFTAVEPAAYTLSVTGSGFKKYEQTSVRVAAQEFKTIDVSLVLGANTEMVEVLAQNLLIDNTTASNGQEIDTQKLQDLPNLGRNPFLFAKLSTNVAAVGDPRFNRFQDQSGSSQISLGGGPVRANNYLVDGIPITDLNNRAVIIPSLEATQEMKLQVNTYDAEVARTGGGVFNTVLKSGTNRLHGTLYGETRQTDWAAHNYFYTPGAPYSATFYTYAGATGGPVVIPHLYNGRDKTFFWVTAEGYRQRSPLSGTYYLPTADERQGNFSASIPGGGSADGSTCPSGLTCLADPLYPGVAGTTKFFQNNIIPSGRINPSGQSIMNAYPVPGAVAGLAPMTPTSSAYESPNASGTDLLGDRADEFVGKVDHQFFPWWFANFSYMHYGSKEPGGNPLHSFAGDESPQSSYLLYRKVDAISQHNTITLNPTTLVTVGFGFNRFPNSSLDLSNGYDITKLGFPSGFAGQLQKRAFPAVVMLNAATNGTSNSGPSVYYSRSVLGDITKILGKHSLKFGYDFRTVSVDFTDVTYSNGQLYFDNSYTGVDLANLLLGFPTSKTSSTSTTTQFTVATRLALNLKYNAVYAQDNYRLTPKLNINYGLRYEYEPGIHERNNHYVVGFNRSVSNPTATYPAAKGGVEFAGVNGYPSACCNLSNTKFAPRVGIAYTPAGKTVFRVGYGVFFAPPYYTASSSLAPGYTATDVYNPYTPGGLSGSSAPLSTLYPSGLGAPTGNSLGYATQLGSTVTFLDQFRRYAFIQQYSIDMEHELPFRMAFKIGYVGAKGRNLQVSTTGTTGYNINQLPDQAMNAYTIKQLSSTCSTAIAQGYAPAQCSSAAGSATLNQALRPFEGFSSVTALGSPAKSLYNSLVVRLEKSTSYGLSFLTTYTWSSNWDSVFGTGSTINSGSTAAQDANDLGAEYARSIIDMPQRFTVGASYDLPVGVGRSYLNRNGWLDLVIGGWTLNAVGIKQSGAPLSLSMNSNGIAAVGASIQHASWAPGASSAIAGKKGRAEGRMNNYFDKTQFATPANGSYYAYGNVPRTIAALGPGLDSWDLSIFKTRKIKEFISLQFRAEAINAFNTPQFGAPNVKIGNANAGVISSQVNLPRYLQLGGQLSF